MKRSEMIEHIEAEMIEFFDKYQRASDKAKPHKSKAAAEGLLAMLEGWGMLTPFSRAQYNKNTHEGVDGHDWEPEYIEEAHIQYKTNYNKGLIPEDE